MLKERGRKTTVRFGENIRYPELLRRKSLMGRERGLRKGEILIWRGQ